MRPDTGSGSDSRGGALLDALFFLSVVGLSAALLLFTTVIPNARRAARAEHAARCAEIEVKNLATRVERLREEVVRIRSDPWAIERALRRKAKERRPDLFPPRELPAAPPSRSP